MLKASLALAVCMLVGFGGSSIAADTEKQKAEKPTEKAAKAAKSTPPTRKELEDLVKAYQERLPQPEGGNQYCVIKSPLGCYGCWSIFGGSMGQADCKVRMGGSDVKPGSCAPGCR